jgi:eukaryotic-like serine/threonine-protein kinase
MRGPWLTQTGSDKTMQPSNPVQEDKDILGYKLKKRIGSGGYGEVWSAVAPGGLPKAVKIIYGFHDEKRALTELKALGRVKELRHPFLLSLERIEVVEGQLIVISELADKSLADLFNQFQAKGEPGIPREQLLKFIRTTADALDYLREEHGLQHLDIKPENLLVVGGHVKVADFGLIKDLNRVGQSMISGMTPTYAAPEMFDGQPGRFSDQYSLAVLYQEMLIGQRPFPGTTPAQLAAQHIHGKPNLSSLPAADQPIVAKALAKDPNHRFPSCRDFAEELSNIKRASRTVVRRLQPTERVQQDTQQKTITFENRDSTSVVSSDALPFQAKAVKILEPPNADPEAARVRPLLVIGVGATANRVVSLLKRQLIGRHGSMDLLPAIKLLCIDTDRNEVTRLCMTDDASAMSTNETLAIPLMKPEYYRNTSPARLAWLGRRWIFNIPRSLQTEGLRPLGRLAFTEHFDAICNKLESTLKQIAQPEAIARTADTLAIDPGDARPRVYVVSSISGGIGSGMVLDLGYAIRLLLAEHGFETDSSELVGLLMHSTYQRSRDPGLAAANAFACFTELRHYVESGYPGDKSIGMPEFGRVAPFDCTYFNELGNDLSQSDLEQQLFNVAEYIYLATMSKCEVFFSGCRKQEQEQEHFSLRTFGLSVAGPESCSARTEAGFKIASTMIGRWIKGRPEENFDPNQFVDTEFSNLQLASDAVIAWLTEKSNQVLGSSLVEIVSGAMQTGLNSPANEGQAAMVYLDSALGATEKKYDLKGNHHDPEICLELEEQIIQYTGQLANQISQQIADRINRQAVDLASAKAIEVTWCKKLDRLWWEMIRLRDQVNDNIANALEILKPNLKDKPPNKHDQTRNQEVLEDLCRWRIEEFLLRFAARLFKRLSGSLATTRNLLIHFEQSLSELQRFFLAKSSSLQLNTRPDRSKIEGLLVGSIEKNLHKLVIRSEIQIYESIVTGLGGYIELFNQRSMERQFADDIFKVTHRVLADAHQQISLEDILNENDIGSEQVVKWINEQIKLAQPKIRDCGGGLRPLLGLPTLTETSSLPDLIQEQLGLKMAPIKGTRGSFVFCFEGEDVSLANIAFRLLQFRPDAVELVKRIHTRNDIEWSTLNDLF